MTIGSLFAGIGGLELGLERAGLGPTVWQVENCVFAKGVLSTHWPRTTLHDDICTVEELPYVDLICGGFPCTGLSDARRQGSKRPGLQHDESSLWYDMLRIVDEVGPRHVVVENVDGGARKHWLPQVRRDLWDIGYPSLPIRVRAADVGAPHLGSRVFVVASTDLEGKPTLSKHEQVELLRRSAEACRKDWGEPSPAALGVADGVPRRMDRLRACGRAVVPQCAEVVGRMLIALTTDEEGKHA